MSSGKKAYYAMTLFLNLCLSVKSVSFFNPFCHQPGIHIEPKLLYSFSPFLILSSNLNYLSFNSIDS